LRRAFIAILSVMLVLLAMPVAPAIAASNARVVVIVGPVGGSTAHYKEDANAIVAEARRYTPNVVKVYTPNATWAKVKAAAQGANVLVYLGHGNGWPSIYAPFQTLTKDGFGLDPGTGANSTKTVYYGEDYIRRDIRLAPNAVVLLYHLCYASGNTEPGLAVGPLSDSRQRVDNYGAGFIGAGARAVIAEGHPAHPAVNYVRQLFTTNRTMEQVFRRAPTFHDNVLGPSSSQRTPGLRFLMDPDSSAPSGFYRSLIGDLSLTAREVVSPGLVRTDTHPAEFVVPGSAQVTVDAGAGLFDTAASAADPAATPSATLANDTRLRVLSEGATAEDGTRILEVRVIGGSARGFVRATALVPRDSAGVETWSLDQSPEWLSPNGDNVSDAFVVAARYSESASAALTVKNSAGTTVKTISATGHIARFAWDLQTASGARIADGQYAWSFRAVDGWANPAASANGTFVVDGTAPVSSAAREATEGNEGWLVTPAAITLTARDALSGVKAISWRLDGGSASTYASPVTVGRNGTQVFEYRATDKAGVKEAWRSVKLRIDTKAPTIALALSGAAGDAEGTWRGPVTVTPTIRDATSGVAAVSFSIDGAPASKLTTATVVVEGDGPHEVAINARDVAGNRRIATAQLVIDTTAPVVDVPAAGATVPTVTPNGDGISDAVALPFSVSEPGRVTAVVTDAAAAVVRTLTVPAAAGEGSVAWDGRTKAGAPAPDGRYTVTLTPVDVAGNAGEAKSSEVDVYAALAALARTPTAFFPQDADKLAPKTVASFTLKAPAVVTIRVLDKDGTVVRTGMTDKELPAGPATWAWNGKTDGGAFAARGTYRIHVAATNGTQRAAQQASVVAEAFRLSATVDAAARGKSLTITAVTVEPLSTTPRVVVRQPGLEPWTVTMTKRGSTTWTAVVTPKRGGTAGTMSLSVKALDTRGGVNSSVLRLALR
jgi:flagellar hook assembly protein FlgD